MARRNKQSVLEDLIDITALMPWWAGATLALVSHVVLHAVATQAPPVMATTAQLSSGVTQAVVSGFAMVGQYLLPLIFLTGALLSFFKRRKSAQLHASAADRADGVAQMGSDSV